MGRGTSYPPELREWAVRMVAEVGPEYRSDWPAIKAVAGKVGTGSAETLRKCVRHAEVDGAARPGVSSEESAGLRKLRAEVRELRRAPMRSSRDITYVVTWEGWLYLPPSSTSPPPRPRVRAG